MSSPYASTHLKPHGPGDSRPTALQVVKDEKREGDLTDKVILITGCSSGLGVESAKALKATGATLYLTARDLDKARTALGGILDDDHKVHVLKLDLASLDSVRSCAAEFLARSQKLNILVANAGVRYTPQGKTAEGFETHIGTNHLGHFLLFQLLKPTLLASSTSEFNSRVVAVSSTAHREGRLDLGDLNMTGRRYDPRLAYGRSKLANVYMANEIERRYGPQGLHAWSLHPGGIRTGLQRPNVHDTAVFLRCGIGRTLNSMQNAEQGSSTTVWAAISRDLEGKGGKYLERCQISQHVKKGFKPIDPGHATWAYDEDDAKKLWDISVAMVGLE